MVKVLSWWFGPVPFHVEGTFVVVGGARYRIGSEVRVTEQGVFIPSGYPGQPDRQIAGPGKRLQDAICLVGLVAGAIGMAVSVLQALT